MNLEEILKNQIENLDIESLVRYEVQNLVSSTISTEISKITKEELSKIIKSEIAVSMSRGVKTDDGWGKKEEFESFEQLFKTYFTNALNDKYEIQKIIRDYVRTEVTKLVEDKTKDITKALSDSLSK